MPRQKRDPRSLPPKNIASLIRGLYGRVARELKVDPSYVSRVARQERRSETIETALRREIGRIIAIVQAGRDRSRPAQTKEENQGLSAPFLVFQPSPDCEVAIAADAARANRARH